MKGDELDKTLERAISTYSREEPRAGFEKRVLDKIYAHGTGNFLSRNLILAALVFACILLLAITFSMNHESIRPSSKPRVIANESNESIVAPMPRAVRTREPQHPLQAKHARAVRFKLPKQQQFPAPTPLTDQERALLALTTRSPNEMAVLVQPESRKDEPIHITEIHIEPLQDGGQE